MNPGRFIIVLVLVVASGLVRWHFAGRLDPLPSATTQIASAPVRSAVSDDNLASAAMDPLQVPSATQPPKPVLTTAELLDEISRLLQSTNITDLNLGLDQLLPELIARDPAMAAQYAAGYPNSPLRGEVLLRVEQGWTAADPAAATQWAAGLTNSQERLDALGNVCLQQSQTSAADAVATAMQYNLGNTNGLMEGLVQQWAGQSLADASAFILKQPPGDDRDALMSRLVFVQSQTDPSAAAALVSSDMSPGPAQTDAAISVLHQWALQDMNAASAWVNQFSDGPLRDQAENELAGIASRQPASQTPR